MTFNLKSCFYVSIALHLGILIVVLFVTTTGSIKTPFLVFGAHSKKGYHTLYKGSLKKWVNNPVPFVSTTKIGRGKSARALHRSGDRHSHGSKQINASHHLNPKSKDVKSAIQSKTVQSATVQSKSKKSKIKEKPLELKRGVSHIKEVAKQKKGGQSVKVKEQKAQKLLQKSKKELLAEKQELRALEELDKKIKEKIDTEHKLRSELDKAKKVEKQKDVKSIEPEVQPNKHTEEDAKEVVIDKNENEPQDIANDQKDVLDHLNENKELESIGAVDDNDEAMLTFNLSGVVDPAMMQYQIGIQKEVERLWRPPIGVPKGTTCSVTFTIDEDGKVKNFEISKRSSVLIYDLSVLRVAHLFKFDRKLWGKCFTIDFCQ